MSDSLKEAIEAAELVSILQKIEQDTGSINIDDDDSKNEERIENIQKYTDLYILMTDKIINISKQGSWTKTNQDTMARVAKHTLESVENFIYNNTDE